MRRPVRLSLEGFLPVGGFPDENFHSTRPIASRLSDKDVIQNVFILYPKIVQKILYSCMLFLHLF